MGQPKWKLLWSTDSRAVFKDETGEYVEEMMVAEEYETERGETRFLVFRFPLDKLKKVGKYLVPDAWDKATYPHDVSQYQEWFVDDLAKVAASVGQPKRQLVDDLTTNDVSARAMVYEAIGGYHGYINFDQYPQSWSEEEFGEKWP